LYAVQFIGALQEAFSEKVQQGQVIEDRGRVGMFWRVSIRSGGGDLLLGEAVDGYGG